MKRLSFAEVLRANDPLLLPAAHDALSAKMIERAGFAALFVSGFGIAGCQLGLPDLGLASFGEVAGAARHIAESVRIPILMDADDGYGDVKNVTRTVRTYESMGLSGIVLEDQASPKKCGHTSSRKRLVATDEAARKIAAACASRESRDFFVVGRTDARGVYGLAEAIERGYRYVEAGADALFVEAPTSIEELGIIGRSFTVPLIVNAAEGGRTPVLSPGAYQDLGFSMILYPGSLMPRMIALFEKTLTTLAAGQFPDDADSFPAFSRVTEIMGMDKWMEVENAFEPPAAGV